MKSSIFQFVIFAAKRKKTIPEVICYPTCLKQKPLRYNKKFVCLVNSSTYHIKVVKVMNFGRRNAQKAIWNPKYLNT